MGRDLWRDSQVKLIYHWKMMYFGKKKQLTNHISTGKKWVCCNYCVAVSVVADDSHAVLCLEKRKGSKKDWLCPLSPARWARPDYMTQGCSSVQRFTRRLWNPLWQLPETKIYLRNTQLPQFLSPATKRIGSLYIMYWHQEFQLLHMQPILVIRKKYWRR